MGRYYKIIKLLKKRWIIISVILCLLDAIFFVAQQYMQKITIDYLSFNSKWNKVQIILYLLIIAYIGTSILFFINGLLFRFLSYKVQGILIQKVYEYFYRLPLWRLKEFEIGEQMKSFSVIEEIANDFFNLPYKLETVMKCIMVYSLLLYINWKITILILFLGILYFIIISINKKRISEYNQKIIQQQFELMKNIEEGIAGIRELIVFNCITWYINNICKIQEYLFKSERKKKRAENYGIVENIGINWGMILIFLIIEGNLLIQNKISIGEFTLCYFLINQFISLISETYYTIISYQEGISKIKKIENFIKDNTEKNTTSILIDKIETLRFEDMCFKYSSDGEYILKNINLFLDKKRDKIIVITGESGSGKSTLIQLLLGKYSLTSGKYLLNGQSASILNIDGFFGVISQNAKLFSGSIYDNIKFGRENISKKEIENMCKKTYIHDFIMQLPENYNYHIGTKGIDISGGQRKRIVLARALLGEPEILIIDEGMAGIDESTAKNIWSNIFQLRREKMTIIVTHKIEDIPEWNLGLIVKNAKINIIERKKGNKSEGNI